LQLGALWQEAFLTDRADKHSQSGGKSTSGTSRAMLRLTEDLVFATEQSYWQLYRAWWTIFCQSAIRDVAITREKLTQELFDKGHATLYEKEQALQNRLEAEWDLERALTNEGEQPGLLVAERHLRNTMGLPVECSLLLPADCPSVNGPLPDLADFAEQAQQYKLEVQRARAKTQYQRRLLDRVTKKEEIREARKLLEDAEAGQHDLEEQVTLAVLGARQHVESSRTLYALAGQKRLAAARILQAQQAAAREKGGGNPTALVQAQRGLVEAFRAERQAAGDCALALLDLEHQAGVLLVRSSIRMPTPQRPNTPRALAPEPVPLQLSNGLPAKAPIPLPAALLTCREDLSLVECLAGLASALALTGLPSK